MIGLLIIYIVSAQASHLDEKAQALLKAKNVKVLNQELQLLETKKQKEVLCEFELSNQIVPRTCYAMKLTKQKLEVIDQACERAVLNMKSTVLESGLSTNCKKWVQKKNQDIQYSQNEEFVEQVVLQK
jgi:hypothetical protein